MAGRAVDIVVSSAAGLIGLVTGGRSGERIRAVDVAFLAIAGQWAEDGKLQGLLDSLGVSYTGSGVLASAAAMHKPTAKALVSAAGVKVLPHILISEGDDIESAARDCCQTLGLPVILKPCSEGGSIGVQVVRTPSPADHGTG